MVSRDEIENRAYKPTTPDDLNDPPRFSQAIETTLDAFVHGLRVFFNKIQSTGRLGELPTIEKYFVGFSATEDPYETTVQIHQDHPDLFEQLPHVAVLGVAGRNKRLTIGRPIVGTVQFPPRVDATLTEPYALADGDVLEFRTKPDGINWVTSTVTFAATRFPTADPITAATAVDMARVINEQALYAHGKTVDGGTDTLRLQTGGVFGSQMPNAIEILSGTTANVITALGIQVGDSDDSITNTARPPMRRYHQGSEITVSIDVQAEDVNTRRELVDLVYSWATMWLESQHFTLMGRSTFDENIDNEWYQVILHQETSLGNEAVAPRPNGDAKDKIHTQRISVPVTTIMYLDRAMTVASGPSIGENFYLQSDRIDWAEGASVSPTTGGIDVINLIPGAVGVTVIN